MAGGSLGDSGLSLDPQQARDGSSPPRERDEPEGGERLGAPPVVAPNTIKTKWVIPARMKCKGKTAGCSYGQ